jgi:hypothetical protein
MASLKGKGNHSFPIIYEVEPATSFLALIRYQDHGDQHFLRL